MSWMHLSDLFILGQNIIRACLCPSIGSYVSEIKYRAVRYLILNWARSVYFNRVLTAFGLKKLGMMGKKNSTDRIVQTQQF